MAQLTDLQKQQIISREPNLSADKILEYILTYDNLSLDDFPKMDSTRRAYITDKITSMPNPVEQKQWENIRSRLNDKPSDELLDLLTSYINEWENKKPNGNHVDEAKDKYDEVKIALDEKKRKVEEDAWKKVDPLSKHELKHYLQTYPNTVFYSEIDESYWGLTKKDDRFEVEDYIYTFTRGKHLSEAHSILGAIDEWEIVKRSGDIFLVHEYIQENSSSPFLSEANSLLRRLKIDEIEKMKANCEKYRTPILLRLLNEGIFTGYELVSSKVVTQTILDNIINGGMDLPKVDDIVSKYVERKITPDCQPGYTDVYFLGIPQTGKSCVLMGVSSSDKLNVNLASAGGDYAAVLQQYVEAGSAIPPTRGTFTTSLECTIDSEIKANVKHKVNLVEMSGEEFAVKIADNPDGVFAFEDMGGSNIAKLLTNSNRKVFFIVIDPTADVININYEIVEEIETGFDEMTGKPIKETIIHRESKRVNQKMVLQKIINIFADSQNAEIMKRVDAIHFIMTKADKLGNSIERGSKALDLFKNRYRGKLLNPLKDLSLKYNINRRTGYCPNLYTFSLGSFFVGNFYEYDSTDSDKLIRAILNSTSGEQNMTLWDKIKRMVN